MVSEPAITTDGLTKRYGDVVAVNDLDLRVERGEVFGFLGPNGAGKTTTIDLLLDFVRPIEGSVTILGHDVQTEPHAARQRVGVLPDGFELWSRSTGYRHLAFAIESKGGDESPEALLDRVGLERAAAERPVGEYSKGMAQRLAMAMALAGEPDLLILDEPSSGLDPHGIRMMQDLVREAAADGTTVFFSSHILGQVAAVCDRVGILDEGELVAVDTIEGLRRAAGAGSRLQLNLVDAPPVDLERLEGVSDAAFDDGILTVRYVNPDTKARVVHRLVEAGVTVRDFEVQTATLDDLFDAYTRGQAVSAGSMSAETGADTASKRDSNAATVEVAR